LRAGGLIGDGLADWSAPDARVGAADDMGLMPVLGWAPVFEGRHFIELLDQGGFSHLRSGLAGRFGHVRGCLTQVAG